MSSSVGTTEQFKILPAGRECVIHVGGAIDDRTRFPEFIAGETKLLILDLDKVTGMNSMGLRNWIHWIRSIHGHLQINFRNCPREVVDQMNILQGFMPNGAIVESFYVPFHCESCGHDENYLATRGRDYMEASVDVREGVVLKEQHPCTVCGQNTNWDILPAKYFAFLKLRR